MSNKNSHEHAVVVSGAGAGAMACLRARVRSLNSSWKWMTWTKSWNLYKQAVQSTSMIVCNLDREVSSQMAFGRFSFFHWITRQFVVSATSSRLLFAPQPWPNRVTKLLLLSFCVFGCQAENQLQQTWTLRGGWQTYLMEVKQMFLFRLKSSRAMQLY